MAALAVVVVGVVLLYFFKPQQFEVLKNEAISYVASVLEEAENTATKPTSEKPASTIGRPSL